MTKPILMKFNILIKYRGDHKKRLNKVLAHIDPQTLVLYSSSFLVFSKYLENSLINFDQI